MHDLNQPAYGLWPVVLFNIVLVLGFVASFMLPKRRVEWRSMGLFAAWIVALFTEMFGFPLTIYALTALLGRADPVLNPFTHINGHLLVVLSGGSPIVYVLVMGITPILFWVAIMLMGSAWRQVHAAEGKLVTDGLYARVRHPQYSAMFLLIASLLIQWPTVLTVLMSPILFVVYYRLAMREEREMEAHASRGPAYLDYKSTVPAFLPRLSTRMARPAGGTGTAS